MATSRANSDFFSWMQGDYWLSEPFGCNHPPSWLPRTLRPAYSWDQRGGWYIWWRSCWYPLYEGSVTYYSSASQKSLNKCLTSGCVLTLHPPTHWTQFTLRMSSNVLLCLCASACVCERSPLHRLMSASACVRLRACVCMHASVCICVCLCTEH